MTAVRVLVVEDDRLTRTMLATNLRHEGFAVTLAEDGERALAALASAAFDLVVLDYMLPGADGLEVLEATRRRGTGTPVLLLTARDETALKVQALTAGADDFLAKPFHVDELIARCRALVRRARAPIELPAAERVRFGAAWVDVPRRLLTAPDGTEVSLGDKEAGLIALFAREPRVVLSRADILDEVWGMDANPIERTVDNYIGAVRKLVEPDPGNPKHLVTVRGRGYQYLP